MRPSSWSKALVWGLVFLAACGGAGVGTAPDPGGAPPQVLASCEAIGQIQSYRYIISLRLRSPAFPEGERAAPLRGFAEELARLLSDMRLEGAFVAPDRSQTVMRFQGEEIELRVIGERSWLRVGSRWEEQAAPPGPDDLLTPRLLCRELVQGLGPSLAAAEAQEETVNGVESVRYRLDRADLQGLAGLLGYGDRELPRRFAVEVWLAREGGWPVRLRIAAADQDEGGQPMGLELFMEFRDVNDPGIRIEPPPVSPPQG